MLAGFWLLFIFDPSSLAAASLQLLSSCCPAVGFPGLLLLLARASLYSSASCMGERRGERAAFEGVL